MQEKLAVTNPSSRSIGDEVPLGSERPSRRLVEEELVPWGVVRGLLPSLGDR